MARIGAPRSVPPATVVTHEARQYVTRCPEVEAVGQGATIEEALADPRDVLRVLLEEEPGPVPALQTHPVLATLGVPTSWPTSWP